jgi:diguanylate cyclase (GGDEF)-like protein
MIEDKQGEKFPQDTHILIVDDDATVRYLMHEFMQTLGYRSYMAASGDEALTYLETHYIDVVITDIMMPGMDGLELTERVKKKYDMEVIVMTGYSGSYSYEEVILKGASDFVFKPVRFEELHLRMKRVLRERHLRQELEKLALTDDLTQLFNARHFYKQLQFEIDRCNRYLHPLSLLLMDIDFFKNYNDTYGHLEGNNVLMSIGQTIRTCLRRMDSAYRYGGEEFTIILPETNGEDAKHVAERVSVAVSSQKFLPKAGEEVKVTVSIGVAQYFQGENLNAFIKRTDMAMYASKQKGRDCITFSLPDTPTL